MAEWIISVIVEVVTDIWTLQCLARWRSRKKPSDTMAPRQRSD